MKRRIYLIAVLALANIVIMKYHEYKGEKKVNDMLVAHSVAANEDTTGIRMNR